MARRFWSRLAARAAFQSRDRLARQGFSGASFESHRTVLFDLEPAATVDLGPFHLGGKTEEGLIDVGRVLGTGLDKRQTNAVGVLLQARKTQTVLAASVHYERRRRYSSAPSPTQRAASSEEAKSPADKRS